MTESTRDETWQVWLRKWIAALSPIATLIAAIVAVMFVAKPQLQLSQDIARQQLRAHVLVTSVRITSITKQEMVATVTVENLGLTPARPISYEYKFSVGSDGNVGLTGPLYPVLGSRKSQTFTAVRTWGSSAELEASQKPTFSLGLEGRVLYQDTFKESHSTYFHFIFNGRVKVGDELQPISAQDEDD